jgi:hypothetical protein
VYERGVYVFYIYFYLYLYLKKEIFVKNDILISVFGIESSSQMLKGDAAPRHQRLPMFCFLFCFGKANEQRRFWLLRPWLFTVLSSFYVLLSCLNYRVYPVAFYRLSELRNLSFDFFFSLLGTLSF